MLNNKLKIYIQFNKIQKYNMEKDNIKIILLSKLKNLIKDKFNFYFFKNYSYWSKNKIQNILSFIFK